MIRTFAILAVAALAACSGPKAAPDLSGSVTVGPNGVRPDVGVSIGGVRFSRGGVRVGLPL